MRVLGLYQGQHDMCLTFNVVSDLWRGLTSSLKRHEAKQGWCARECGWCSMSFPMNMFRHAASGLVNVCDVERNMQQTWCQTQRMNLCKHAMFLTFCPANMARNMSVHLPTCSISDIFFDQQATAALAYHDVDVMKRQVPVQLKGSREIRSAPLVSEWGPKLLDNEWAQSRHSVAYTQFSDFPFHPTSA